MDDTWINTSNVVNSLPIFSTVGRRHRDLSAGVIIITVFACPSFVPSPLLTAQTSNHNQGSACDKRLPVLKTEAAPRRPHERPSLSDRPRRAPAKPDACLLSYIPDSRRGFASRLRAWYTARSAWGKENKWEPQSGIRGFKVTVAARWRSWAGRAVVLFMRNEAH